MKVREMLKRMGTKSNANDTLTITFEYEDVDVILQSLGIIYIMGETWDDAKGKIPNNNQIRQVQNIITASIANK